MAQADEMGEDGEGERDDGFVEGADSVRRRTKKRPSELTLINDIKCTQSVMLYCVFRTCCSIG